MPSRRRPQVLRAAACLGVAVAVAGCSSTAATKTAVTAKGQTLVLNLGEPPAPDAVQKQVLQAEQLACPQAPQSLSGTRFSIKCETVQQSKPSDSARAAIQNESSIAYIGEIEPGSSGQSIGITNALDLLQVSPTDTAVELTQSTAAVPGAPARYYESSTSYGRTFARVVPTTTEEAAAQVSEMKAVGVHSLYIPPSDGSDYGRAIAAAVRQQATGHGLQVRSSETAADAIFYAGDSASAANRFAASASSTATSERLFLPSSFAGMSFSSGSWSRFRAVYVSSPAAAPGADKQFRSQFASRYGGRPAPEAVFGYAAVQAVIHVLQEAGKAASNRSTVVHDFHKLSNFSSAAGTFSIDAQGDTSLGANAFVFSRLRGGTLVPLTHGTAGR